MGPGTDAFALEFGITNTAYADFKNEFNEIQATATSSTSFTVVASSPALVVSASPSATALWDGDPVVFTLTVFNAGDDSAFNIFLLDTLPGLVVYAGPATPSADPGWDPATGLPERLRWTLTQLDIGATAYIQFTAVGPPLVPAVQAGINGLSVHYGGETASSTTVFEVWRSAPSAPPYLSASAGASTVWLSWAPATAGRSPVTGYLVYRSTGAGVPETLYDSTFGPWSTGYVDALPILGVTMCYSVRAMDSAGRVGARVGPMCASASAINGPLLVVTGRVSSTAAWDDESPTFFLTLYNAGNDSAFNIWVLDTLPALFRYAGIMVPPAVTGWDPATGPPERMLWNLARLDIGKTVTIRFTASGIPPAGISGPGDTNYFTVNYGTRTASTLFDAGDIWRSAPSAPAYLSVSSGTQSVALSWVPALPGRDPVTGYLVYRSIDGGVPAALYGSVFGPWSTGFTDALPDSGGTACYTVRAVDSAGRLSVPTAPACVTPDSTPPPGTVHLVVAITDSSGRVITVLRDGMVPAAVDSVSVMSGEEYISLKSGGLVKITLSDGSIMYWDGRTSGGEPVPNGFYTVVAASAMPNGQVKKATDTFTLVRSYEKLILSAVFVPNPAKEGVWLSYSLASPLADMTVRIYNIAGELVWKAEVTGAGASLRWDLKNREGTQVVPGLYVAVLDAHDPVTGMKDRKLLRLAVVR